MWVNTMESLIAEVRLRRSFGVGMDPDGAFPKDYSFPEKTFEIESDDGSTTTITFPAITRGMPEPFPDGNGIIRVETDVTDATDAVGLSVVRFRVWPWQRAYTKLKGLLGRL